ncbi:hypothetical protein [Streptomyces sp. Caat 7-52]|uniref:hypothetical protein n=1 Tax=Streptomyces sp. Caat 7-52 TaxID=2949637 RepID=UPI002035FA10|nr:hypothetical protein [Streptomyces sp. Caat 7-52]
MTVLAAGLLPAAQTEAVAAAEWLAVIAVRWAQELACDSGLAQRCRWGWFARRWTVSGRLGLRI